ncbi:hypothetical protein [Actinocorallia libanotica]|uniref:ADP-ribosylglycohydrolase n=1 Tax=Actinocorallia libanotica TaxID=46162 RepID=A0ABN1Q774_9ACTN
MGKSRKNKSWWRRVRGCLRPGEHTDPAPDRWHGHYWIGGPVGDLLDGAACGAAVGAVFATHPDLLRLDAVLDRIARTES